MQRTMTLGLLALLSSCAATHEAGADGGGEVVTSTLEFACSSESHLVHLQVAARPVDGEGCLLMQVSLRPEERNEVSAEQLVGSSVFSPASCAEAPGEDPGALTRMELGEGVLRFTYGRVIGLPRDLAADITFVAEDGRWFRVSGELERAGGDMCP